MKTRSILLSVAVVLCAAAIGFAQSPQIGTWKLNEAKSKIPKRTYKNDTVTFEAAGDKIKVTVDGTGPDGTPSHTEWTGNFDGKDYPVTGNPNADTRSYKQVNNRTLAYTEKKDGKVTISGRVTVAPDGKTRTSISTRIDSSGKKITSTSVYDKQS